MSVGKRGGSANQGDRLPLNGKNGRHNRARWNGVEAQAETGEIASGHVVGAQPSRLHTPEARRKSGRSKIANGSGSLLPTTDGRSLWARIRRDTYRAIVQMCGGDDMVSETQTLMARRVGTLEAELVFIEDKFA